MKSILGTYALLASAMMMGAQGSVGTSRRYTATPQPRGWRRAKLRNLKIDDAYVHKGNIKETIRYIFNFEGYKFAIEGDITYTNEKRRNQRINALEREIGGYIMEIGLKEVLSRKEFEILEEPKKEEPIITTEDEQNENGESGS